MLSMASLVNGGHSIGECWLGVLAGSAGSVCVRMRRRQPTISKPPEIVAIITALVLDFVAA